MFGSVVMAESVETTKPMSLQERATSSQFYQTGNVSEPLVCLFYLLCSGLPRVNTKSSIELLALRILTIVGVLTGLCPIDVHGVKLKNLKDTSYQSCMQQCDIEILRHFLLVYSALARLRLKHPRRDTIGDLGELANTTNHRRRNQLRYRI